MGMPPLRFVRSLTRLSFGKPVDLVGVRALSAARKDEHLNLQNLQSTGDSVVLQSISGSTKASVKAEEASLEVHYFGSFAEPESAEQRFGYQRAKVGALLALIDTGGGKTWPQFVGCVVVARVMARDHSQFRQLVGRTADALGLSAVHPHGEAAPMDITLRVARELDEEQYVSITVNSVEERTIEVRLGQPFVKPKDWEIVPTSMGIEMQYDRNNKLALRKGKRVWTAKDAARVVDEVMADSTSALQTIYERIGAEWTK